MKKRTLFILLVSVLLIILITSCTGKTTNIQTNSADKKEMALVNNTNPTFKISKDVPESDSFTLPGLVGENMVLQRDRVLTLWGGCTEDGPIAVTLNGSNYYGLCTDGKWEVYISPQTAGGPYDITVQNINGKIVIKNVLIGDVYICSGQSNMEMTMVACNVQDKIDSSTNSKIRLLRVITKSSETPISESDYIWGECNPRGAGSFSATGYFFGKTLQEKYNIPIGLVMSALGDTILCCWSPDPEASAMSKVYQTNDGNVRRKPAYFYNGMINPLKSYKYKGVLWYQGENQPEEYDNLLVDMIKGWRRDFNDENLGFTIIQLPRWGGGNAEAWFVSREKQKNVSKLLSNVTYSVNIDTGDNVNIHPMDKEKVGIRAAYATMEALYDEKGVLRGPIFKAFKIENNKVLVEFDMIGSGLVLNNEGKGFEIHDSSGDYYEAKAKIVGDKIELTSEMVTSPAGVRYAYGAFPDISLYNKDGFPAEQFRTKIID